MNIDAVKILRIALVLALIAFPAAAAAAERSGGWAPLLGTLPEDLARPEGRTRWDFTGLPPGPGAARGAFVDPTGGDAARRWLRPHLDDALLQPSARLELELSDGETVRRLLIDVRRVGGGWVGLPDGPREVVLQRAVIHEAVRGGTGGGSDRDYRPARLLHRWVDPRAGVVAEVEGALGADGRTRVNPQAAIAIDVEKGAGLRIYADEIDVPRLTHVAYGYDRGNVAVSALTPEGHATIGDLVAAGAWDFSGTGPANSVAEVASTRTTVSEAETCNHDKCGFNRPGVTLAREDKNFDDLANLHVTLSAQEREDRAGDVTVWLRAGVTNEGEEGAAVGDGENRICFVDEGRTEVPLFRFAHQDAAGFYMQNGDTWDHSPFACELNIFALSVCPEPCGSFCPNRTFACGDHAGVQTNEVIGEGPVTLPSGHTFNALLVKNVAEFCVSPFSGCPTLFAQEVRTVVYLWLVPHLGTVVRLMSTVSEADDSSFTTLAETDIKFGIFPPRSISLTAATETTLDVAWDPGLDTHRIDGYRVYWDTDSGAASPYGFDSFSQPGQVAVNGTTATISGLTPGTEYFVTVTAVSEFTNPRTGVPTTYESLLFPTNVAATPASVPAEINATTEGGTCVLTAEVGGLTLDRVSGAIEFCWDVADEPCLTGYQLLGADAPESDLGFSVLVEDTGLSTCHTVESPGGGFFLAVGAGAGATGPWGHYDR